MNSTTAYYIWERGLSRSLREALEAADSTPQPHIGSMHSLMRRGLVRKTSRGWSRTSDGEKVLAAAFQG